MTPQIRYCTASDGVRIAYWTMGSGPALLHDSPGPFGDIGAELGLDEPRAWYERLAQSHTLIRYDPRGCGASDRDGVDQSLGSYALDLDAVACDVSRGAVALFASSQWVPMAITFAARHAKRVSHLILWDGYARASDFQPRGGLVAARALIEQDWTTYTNAWAQAHWGWSRASTARAWAHAYHDATTPESTLRRQRTNLAADVSALLPRLAMPVLIVDHRDRRTVLQSGGQHLAANVPNARLVVLDGGQGSPAARPEHIDANARIIDEFTGVPVPETPVADAPAAPEGADQSRGTAIVLFTDIADSTALTESMGDAAFRHASSALDQRIRAAVLTSGGTPVEGKVLGDGVMAIFRSAAQAIDAALRIIEVSVEGELRLHVGLHAGDVIHEKDNAYGGAVNLAARVCALSDSGEILVTGTIRDLARTSADVTFEDRGEHALKGIEDPVRIYAVRARG